MSNLGIKQEQLSFFDFDFDNVEVLCKVKNNGQVYTPSFIINNILDTVSYTKENILRKHIIDNSCGDGAFLLEIVKRYINEYQRTYSTINEELKIELETYIHGIEIQHDEYIKCINNLNQITDDIGLKNVQWNIINADTLTIDSYDNQMDFVVGNPPYVRVHNLKNNYESVKKYKFAQNGMTDLYIVFFEIGFNMLNSNGKMCLISPNSYLNSKAGEVLRDYIYKNRNLKEIINLGHFQPFDGITTYTAISLFDSNENNTIDYFEYSPDIRNKGARNTLSYDEIFIDGNIYLSDKKTLKELKEMISTPIGSQLEVKNGFATLSDSIFIGNFNFEKYTIDILKASTGKTYKCFYPYDVEGKPISLEKLAQEKDVYQYLFDNKSNLENRSIENKREWYLFGRTQGLKDTYKYKISINTTIKDVGSIKLIEVEKGKAIYSGLYMLCDKKYFETIQSIIKHKDFISYIQSLKKYKSGGYYTFSSLDLKRYLNKKLLEVMYEK